MKKLIFSLFIVSLFFSCVKVENNEIKLNNGIKRNSEIDDIAFIIDLNVNNNTHLGHLNCAVNNLTTIDVSENSVLKFLVCYTNSNLTTIYVNDSQDTTKWSIANKAKYIRK